jgi:hypothetical protein
MTLFAGNMNAGTEEPQIVDTVSTIFAAALTDDVAKFDSVIASDFYIFDRGARFKRRQRYGLHQGPTCCGQALRVERDRTRRPH